MSNKPSIVFAHGLWADGSCFSKLIPTLLAEGHDVMASQHGLDSLGVIGADRITFETDYPHTDSTWPDTRAVAEQMVRHLSDNDVYAIMRGNAIEMLGLDIA